MVPARQRKLRIPPTSCTQRLSTGFCSISRPASPTRTSTSPRPRRRDIDISEPIISSHLGLSRPSIARREGRKETRRTLLTRTSPLTWGRERVGLLVVRKNCPLHRHLVRAVREVLAHKGLGAGSAANGHACSATTLGYMEEQFVVVVANLWEAQLVFLDDALKQQELIKREVDRR